MRISKYILVAIIGAVVFSSLVALTTGVSARFDISNITVDPYKFVQDYLNQWSLALSAAGTMILAISVFSFIYENRRREEQVKQQAIHALHDEILWNLNNVVFLRFRISEYIRYIDEHKTTPSTPPPFEPLENRVFDDMRSRGQLHLLEDLRMEVLPCYKFIRDYNMDKEYKPHHLEFLKMLHEGLERNIRALESKFKFLPPYIKEEDKAQETIGDMYNAGQEKGGKAKSTAS